MPRSHKTLPRLYVSLPLVAGSALALEREQTNYLVNVLRMQAGDHFVLFNGRDGAWLTVMTEAHRKGAIVTPETQIAVQTPVSDLWFGFAPLKTGRLDYLVQKATEMGAGTIQPIITRFTQVRKLRRDKLEANVVEAAEQCEVLSVPVIGEEIELDHLLADWPQAQAGRQLVFCDEAAPSGSPIEALKPLSGRPIGVLIGPEGGFSDEERQKLLGLDFVTPVSLGPRILRADTAAVAALAVVQSIIGDWR